MVSRASASASATSTNECSRRVVEEPSAQREASRDHCASVRVVSTSSTNVGRDQRGWPREVTQFEGLG